MNYFDELMRIADRIEDKKDADIVRAAAVKCIESPKPDFEMCEKIEGYGYLYGKTYR